MKTVWAVQPAGAGVEMLDVRMLMLMRCVLAFSALAIIWLDPSEPRLERRDGTVGVAVRFADSGPRSRQARARRHRARRAPARRGAH